MPELQFLSGKPKVTRSERLCSCGKIASSHVGKGGVRYYAKTCRPCRDTRRHVAEACEACGHRPVTPELLEVDHILPRSRGGDNSPENLQTLCANCHKIKTLLDRVADHEMRDALLAGRRLQIA